MGKILQNYKKQKSRLGDIKSHLAELLFIDVFRTAFIDTDYIITKQPKNFKNIYKDVKLTKKELSEIYNPSSDISGGIVPDAAITNKRTGKTIYVEIKRQNGWVEGKPKSEGRGNAHERLCKYFMPGLLKRLQKASKIAKSEYPIWAVFEGDITRDPIHVREITCWFEGHLGNLFFWRKPNNAESLILHFENHIAPLLN